MGKIVNFKLVSLITLCSVFSGCAQSVSTTEVSDLTKKYGIDSNYFMGLQAEKDSDQKTAAKYFQKAVSSQSQLIATLAEKELLAISDEKLSLNYADSFYKKHTSEESLASLVGELYNAKQFDRILSLTKNIDYATADDETIYYRCLVLLEKNDPSLPAIFNLWCESKPYSNFHNRIFSALDDYPENNFTFATDTAKLRNAVYEKEWGRASTYAKRILDDQEKLKTLVVSDAGKALLYGSTNYEANAKYLESSKTGNKEIDYYLNFYAGRIYAKLDSTIDKAMKSLRESMNCAQNDEQYDNSLWYYLSTAQGKSLETAILETNYYRTKWHDPEYFDDFFDSLSVDLLNKKKWEEYYNLTNSLTGYASPETVSKFCYTTARLIENDFYVPDGADKESLTKKLYQQALNGGTNSYHKLMAATKLNLSLEETWKYFEHWHKDSDLEVNEEVEKILYGYIDYDLSDQIFLFWLDHFQEISFDCAKALSEYLKEKAKDSEDLYYVSLRIAAKKLNNSEVPLDKKMLELSFPCDFSEHVERYCSEYKLYEYIAYALIRMESFYSPTAISHAGATGLCQLMDATANDIAKKLKKENFDLMDPETNIQFGTNYLSELISRLDGNKLLAICSYNAGIGKMRSTLKKISAEMERDNLPMDIFLEMLPITETRNYGRNVTAAAAIYAYLYYGIHPAQVMEDITGIQ